MIKPKSCYLQENWSNMLTSETFLPEHKDVINYAQHLGVVSNGGTHQEKNHVQFKNEGR